MPNLARDVSPVVRRWLAVLGAPVVLLVVGFVSAGNAYWVHLATAAVIAYILTAAFNLVYGYAGIFNLSLVGLYGLGAFTSVYAENYLHQSFGVSALIAVVVTTALSVVVALPTRRLNEMFLAIETLAFALALAEVITKWTSFSGGSIGIYTINPPVLFGVQLIGNTPGYFWLCAVFACVVFEVMRRVNRSGAGRRFVALREDRRTLSAVGSSPGSASLVAFAVSGALAGLAGVLYAYFQLAISLEAFSFERLIQLLLATIIGGAGFLLGPVFGVIALVVMDEVSLATSESQNLVLGLGILVLVALGRGGIAGLVQRLGDAIPTGLRFWRTSLAHDANLRALPGLRDALSSHGERRLTADSVSVSFGGTHAVRDVSLTVASGEVVGLIGPNGAGKTSMINALSGDVHLASGTVTLDGVPVDGKKQDQLVRLGIGRTFQSPKLIPDLSLLDNLILAGDADGSTGWLRQLLRTRKAGRQEGQSRVLAMRLLHDFGLAERADQPANGQPYGVLRLVEIARNLMLDPAFLLLDEPGAGLTDEERDEVAQHLRLVASRGIGVLLIDHNLSLITAVCERLYVMDVGQLIASGSPDEVLAHEQVVSAYLGVPQ